jgi:hypothetical protein
MTLTPSYLSLFTFTVSALIAIVVVHFSLVMESVDEGDEDTPEKSHPPVSPASGAESWLLAGLETSSISSSALASQLRKNSQSPSFHSDISSAFSVATDDFATCLENADDLSFLSIDDENSQLKHRNFSSVIPELDSDSESDDPIASLPREFSTMSTKMSKVSSSTPTPLPPKKGPNVVLGTTDDHPDAASHVYEGAKGVWAWGKGVGIISPFLGIAEAVAGRAVKVVGTDLEEIDGNIKPQLSKLDGKLNPALEAVISIILGAAGKAESILKPIIVTFLKPFGLIKNGEDTPEVTK